MDKNPAAVALGKMGGKALVKKKGKEYFKELNKKSHEAKKRRKLLVDERSQQLYSKPSKE